MNGRLRVMFIVRISRPVNQRFLAWGHSGCSVGKGSVQAHPVSCQSVQVGLILIPHLNKGLVTWHTRLLRMLGNTKDEDRALMDAGSCCQKHAAKNLGLATLELPKLLNECSSLRSDCGFQQTLSRTFQM